MGKKAKEHRAKVQKRNQRVEQEKNILKKKWNEMFEKKMGELQESFSEMSGDTESNEEESAKINKEFEPEYDSAGFTIEDRELPTEE